MMQYKGYAAVVTFDEEAEIFHGEVADTRDVITFQGTTVEELRQAFRDSVDDYLEFCALSGEKPDKPFSGSFPVRLSPDLHRRISVAAKSSGMSVNAYVARVLDRETPRS